MGRSAGSSSHKVVRAIRAIALANSTPVGRAPTKTNVISAFRRWRLLLSLSLFKGSEYAGEGEGLRVSYDYLVLATGATHSYFGHDEFAHFAPGLKNLADAESLRNRILTAFENAEAEENPERRKALMTFIMVGAGPTGVELASAIALMARTTLEKNFRRIDPKTAHIILVDMAKRPLGTFAESLSQAAKLRLLQLGVDVRLEKPVQAIDGEGVVVGGERIPSKTVIWTAGVAPSPAGKWLGCEVDRAGRVRIRPDLTVQDHPEIFVIGDTASLDQDGRPLPWCRAGCHAARTLRREIDPSSGDKKDHRFPPFLYFFIRVTVPLSARILPCLQSGRVMMSGFLAWLVWALIHIQFLAESSLRFTVFFQWAWTYFS